MNIMTVLIGKTSMAGTADYWNKTERADQKPSGNTKSGYSTKKKNQFNSFNQRDISSSDMSELEQRLLNRG